jgi:DNA-binding IclR family transcriptional regulator
MDSVRGAGVLDKAVVVLHAVAAAPRSLAELQAASGLPRATAHRLAVAMEGHGLLRRDGSGRFCLGLELVALGRAAAEQLPLVESARAVLADLRDRTGESVQLYVRDGTESRRCVLSLQSPHGLRWIVPEGALLPLAVGSAGRALTSPPTATGWVASVEEREPGVASVSAAVLGPDGEPVGAVSVSGPVERLTRQPGRRFGADVADAARAVEAAIAAR